MSVRRLHFFIIANLLSFMMAIWRQRPALDTHTHAIVVAVDWGGAWSAACPHAPSPSPPHCLLPPPAPADPLRAGLWGRARHATAPGPGCRRRAALVDGRRRNDGHPAAGRRWGGLKRAVRSETRGAAGEGHGVSRTLASVLKHVPSSLSSCTPCLVQLPGRHVYVSLSGHLLKVPPHKALPMVRPSGAAAGTARKRGCQ